MAASREAFYEQLPVDTVRTIVLSPGSQTDPLRCHFRLQRIPPSEKKDVRFSYEALSYTWGAPTFSQYIACRSATWASSSSTAMTILRTLHSGRKLKSTEVTISITQNLHDALVHLRQRWTSRELWVDAICINQEDNAEKAAQIPLMGRVYFLAKRVIIWLGLLDAQTTQTLALINMIAITAKLETGLRRPTMHDLELEEFDEARHTQRRLPSWVLEIEKWQALGAFLSRPWFSRVWILQEVILAPEALVQVGGNSMDWADLCTAVIFLVQKYFYASMPPGATNLSQCLDRLLLPCSFSRCVRPAIWNDPTARPMDLCELLVTSHQYQATVARDKVYAFLGLANEYDVLVDYEVELRDVYVDVARYLLSKNDTGTRSLCLESVHHYPDIDVGFPSWVPKWHVPLRRVGINAGEADTEFKAGGDDDIEIPRHPSNPSVLELTGFVLGRVEISHKIRDSNNGPEVWDLLVFARSLLCDHTGYHTADPLDKVIMSTITQVDESHDVRAFQDLFIDAYQHKLEDLAAESKGNEAAAMRGEWQAEVSKLVTMSQEPKAERNVNTKYKNTLLERSFFRTQEGYVGLGPYIVQPGDLVGVLFGLNVPYVLRPVREGFLLVGECYIHGVMKGEKLTEGRQKKRDFLIL